MEGSRTTSTPYRTDPGSGKACSSLWHQGGRIVSDACQFSHRVFIFLFFCHFPDAVCEGEAAGDLHR